jgi:competence protein ComEC
MMKYPFIGAALGLIVGILVGFYFSSPATALSIFTAALSLVVISFIRIEFKFFINIWIVFFIVGCFYTHQEITVLKESQDYLSAYLNQPDILWKGTVVSDVRYRKGFRGTQTSFVLALEYFKNADTLIREKTKLLVQIYDDVPIFYGDAVELNGRLASAYNFSIDSNFSYPDYLFTQGVVYILHVKKDFVSVKDRQKENSLIYYSLKCRENLKTIYDRYLTARESALMKAFVLGDRSNLPNSFKQMFVETGTAHILAISGLNIGIVVYLLLIFLKTIPIPRKLQILITILMISFYAFMTGFGPSVVRATIMAVIFLLGILFEREAHSLNSLALAALIILLLNPFNLFDIGFQLSFICVFAIVQFYPMVTFLEKISAKKGTWQSHWLFRYLVTSFWLSIIVWLWVAGFVVYYFKILTPVTILANLIVVPLSSLIVALGLGLIFFGLCFSLLSPYFAICLKLVLNILFIVTFLFQNLPFGFVYTPRINGVFFIFYYITVGILFWYISKRFKQAQNPKLGS